MPGLVKILAAFVAIVWMVRKKVQLGTAMLLGSIVLILLTWLGHAVLSSPVTIPLRDLPFILLNAVWDSSSRDPASILKLIGVIVLVLILSHCLDKTGQMNRILESFQALVGDVRIVLITLPALIGLLPMPGGAVFSAPMVEAAQKGINIPPNQKTLINYWFRHIWEYSWPLYPGLLLAAELGRESGWNLSVFKLAAIQSPLTAAALIGGILFFIRNIPRTSPHRNQDPLNARLSTLAVDISPIGVIIILVILLTTAFALESKSSLLLSLVAAILLTLALSTLKKQMPPVAVLKSISVARILALVYVIAALMVFRETIEQSRSVNEISVMMKTYNVPLFPFVVLLSFISGLVMGLTMAYIGIVFPILMPLLLQVHADPLPYLVLAFGSGFIGVLFSPVHVCLILTHEYFTSDFTPVYRKMIVPALIIFATLIALFFVLSLTPR
ncbi:MAG: DUF401 family protein [bacterium]|nr:DUF401 family protein [bacterium]